MSDLHKAFLKRIQETEASMGLSTVNEDQDMIPMMPPLRKNHGPKRERTEKNHFLIWHQYHHEKSTFESYKFHHDDITLQVYRKPPQLLHLGKNNGNKLTYIFNHGAGSSSMSFSKLSQKLSSVIMYDMRGHGQSSTAHDYSLDVLTEDFKSIIDQCKAKWDLGSIILVGHSLGGCILTNYLMKYPHDNLIKGLVMLDIVEETAVSSLAAMPGYIDKLPPSFITYEDAITWHQKNGLLDNLDSGIVSIPDLFIDNGEKLIWKMNLRDTEPFWSTWFTKLSSNFISCGQHVAKLLILAGHESLDKDLMIGQMQGKYQLVVLNSGHFLQEDVPSEVGVVLLDFGNRVEDPEEYMKKELGIIPKWGGKINK